MYKWSFFYYSVFLYKPKQLTMTCSFCLSLHRLVSGYQSSLLAFMRKCNLSVVIISFPTSAIYTLPLSTASQPGSVSPFHMLSCLPVNVMMSISRDGSNQTSFIGLVSNGSTHATIFLLTWCCWQFETLTVLVGLGISCRCWIDGKPWIFNQSGG